MWACAQKSGWPFFWSQRSQQLRRGVQMEHFSSTSAVRSCPFYKCVHQITSALPHHFTIVFLAMVSLTACVNPSVLSSRDLLSLMEALPLTGHPAAYLLVPSPFAGLHVQEPEVWLALLGSHLVAGTWAFGTCNKNDMQHFSKNVTIIKSTEKAREQ